LLVAKGEGQHAAIDGEAINEAAAAILPKQASLAPRAQVNGDAAQVRSLALRPVNARGARVARANEDGEVGDAAVELVIVIACG